jgi:hypothetical protein
VGENGEHFAQGEAVFLVAELRGDRRIHEIGTRAHVLADHGAVIVLHLDGSEAEVVTCPKGHVARAVERSLRTAASQAARGPLRPVVGSA